MYNGDQARKNTLIEHGFRLPSARDNRPLNFQEFNAKLQHTLYVSATPAEYECAISAQIVEQVIRPTGLPDPPVEVRPLKGQIDDLMEEVRQCAERGDRSLVITLTKKTAEDLARYLAEAGLRVEHLHSDIDAIERVDVLTRLRKGEFDCLVGINLLREGLDLPEVALVAILDADKEGFLRSDRSLIQIAGRTARHEEGHVILYADVITGSMRRMMDITQRRREKQLQYNEKHKITPKSVKRSLSEQGIICMRTPTLGDPEEFNRQRVAESGADYGAHDAIQHLEREMLKAAEALEFERAAALRDEIKELRK